MKNVNYFSHSALLVKGGENVKMPLPDQTIILETASEAPL